MLKPVREGIELSEHLERTSVQACHPVVTVVDKLAVAHSPQAAGIAMRGPARASRPATETGIAAERNALDLASVPAIGVGHRTRFANSSINETTSQRRPQIEKRVRLPMCTGPNWYAI